MTTVKKITKKAMYATVLDILADAESRGFALPEGMDFGALSDFVNHEIELLDKKAESAAKRAADKKVAGDALRDRIFGVLSDTEFKTTTEIVSALGDPDVSSQMVTARLTQLIHDGFVPRITPQLWAKMTHEQATEQITRGKLAEQRVARQAA